MREDRRLGAHLKQARRSAAMARLVLGLAGLALAVDLRLGLALHPALAAAGFGVIAASAAVQLRQPSERWLEIEESLAGIAGLLIIGLGGQRVGALQALWLAAVAAGVLARGGRVHWIGRVVVLTALALPMLLDSRVELAHLGLCVATVALLLTCGRVTNELRSLLETARHEADHDPLTGTLARGAFRDELTHRLAEMPDDLGLMIIDLDRFSQVNKVHGHAAGDAVLVRAAERVREVVDDDAVLGRLGGDELALVVPAAEAQRVAADVSRTLSRPHGAIALGASIGLAVAPEHGRGADALMRAADVALRVAKRSGGGQVQTYAGQDFGRSGPMGARGTLARLIAGEGRSMVVQPIIDVAAGTVDSYEVLARFDSRGDVGPVHWFALADEFGMRDRLELACLEEALELYDRRPPGVGVTVNLSGPVLLDLRTVELMSSRGDLSGLVIEVTEETMVRHDAALAAAIEPMLERGARFAVDDIGAGYSGLRQITALHPSYLKLDRALIRGIENDDRRAAMIEALVGYSERTGSQIVAEGVETEAEYHALAALGVPLAQGYLLGRPGAPWPAATVPASETLRDGAAA